jgi:hypothetical protein
MLKEFFIVSEKVWTFIWPNFSNRMGNYNINEDFFLFLPTFVVTLSLFGSKPV